MNDERGDWREQEELERERYEANVQALKRCLKAGAKPEDVKFIAGECGIDPKHITIGDSNASH